MKSKLVSVSLYLMFALMWCGIIYFYLLMFLQSDIMNYVWNGILKDLFIIVSFVCMFIPIIFRRKLKLRKPLLMVIFTVLSVLLNFVLYCSAACYISNFSKEKWDNHEKLRYCMVYSIERKYEMTNKSKQEITTLLGKPDYVQEGGAYRYYIGGQSESFYIYDIFFEKGVVARTEVRNNGNLVSIESMLFPE